MNSPWQSVSVTAPARIEPARVVSDAERRARLSIRHGLTAPFASIDEATRALLCWHATDNSTVYLSLGARVTGVGPGDIDTALYDDRTLVKQMAMRRTIFGFTREQLPAAIGACGLRVAEQERRRTVKDLGGGPQAEKRLAELEDLALDALRESPLSTTQLRSAVPDLDVKIHVAPGTKWGGEQPIAPRLMTILSAAGQVVRGPNKAHWRSSRPLWVAMDTWLGEEIEPLEAREGYRELVGHWLQVFGPGTETDIVWWFGATKAAIRQALADVGAVGVQLEDGQPAWLYPDDLEVVGSPTSTAALLPVLDPTTMGWKERDFYLGPHGVHLFDRAGNGGNTAWWDGRIVGGWIQTEDGEIVLQLLEDVSPEATEALSAERDRLMDWLGDVRVYTYFPSPLMRSGA